jgi:hypothetical protein
VGFWPPRSLDFWAKCVSWFSVQKADDDDLTFYSQTQKNWDRQSHFSQMRTASND